LVFAATSLARDLDDVLEQTRDLFEHLRGQRVLITGGTGFVGTWLLEALVWADKKLSLGTRAYVLTRDPKRFAGRAPHLAGARAVKLLSGDVRSVVWPRGEFAYVVHGATPSDAQLNEGSPREMLDIIQGGTDHVLELVTRVDGARMLLLSSGAVYAPSSAGIALDEESPIGSAWPDEPSAYHAGKRAAERAAAASACDTTIARLFAFVGPYLPLNRHFAVGNFIGAALEGREVAVAGDGQPVRSYLYGSDMAAWLWTMLLHPCADGEIFNVGSEDAISVGDVARLVAETVEPPCAVSVVGGGTFGAGLYYVPSTAKARSELGLQQTVAFPEALRRTLAWHTRALS
jgi:dTDP-glucose 4,6-dehydratase